MSTITILSLSDINAMDATEVKRFISSTRTSIKAHEDKSQNLTDRAAYATYMAEHVQGIIGKDNKDNPGHMTDQDWAASFDKVKSITGAWRTLGHVLVELGMSPENETYVRFRKSNIYQTADGKKVANAATAESIEADLVAFMDGKVDEFGKRVAAKRAANPEGQTKSATKVESFADLMEVEDVAKRATVILAALDQTVALLSTDQWVEVDALIETLRQRENDRHAAQINLAG
jgi:hypothetical protein